jgi:hypothetical protein
MYSSGPFTVAQSTAGVWYGTEIWTELSYGAKYRLKCSRGDRERNGTGADNMNWCLVKQIRCRVWWERSLWRSKCRLKDNIKVDVK